MKTFQILFIFSVFLSTTAHACKCKVATAEVWLQAEEVFVGKIMSLTKKPSSSGDVKSYNVKVLDPLKNPIGKKVLLETQRSSAMCGVPLKVGKIYTFFSSSEKVPYSVNSCGGTHEGLPSKEELRALKRPR